VGAGVTVAGTSVGVGEARGVDVGKKGSGVAVAGWQAVKRMRHPIKRSFSITLITAGRIE
jgi:hypothetical protein